MQTLLAFDQVQVVNAISPAASSIREPAVMTYRQYAMRNGYDIDMSHDRLRFPNGISQRQERDNRRAARHHLQEGIRAMNDYNAAVMAGEVRPPTDAENRADTMKGHPDNQSVQAAWRLAVKRARRRSPDMTEADAVRSVLSATFPAGDCWAEALGAGADVDSQVAARCHWLARTRS